MAILYHVLSSLFVVLPVILYLHFMNSLMALSFDEAVEPVLPSEDGERFHADENMKIGDLFRCRKRWFLQRYCTSEETLKKFRDFELHRDDIIVASFPKSGGSKLLLIKVIKFR